MSSIRIIYRDTGSSQSSTHAIVWNSAVGRISHSSGSQKSNSSDDKSSEFHFKFLDLMIDNFEMQTGGYQAFIYNLKTR